MIFLPVLPFLAFFWEFLVFFVLREEFLVFFEEFLGVGRDTKCKLSDGWSRSYREIKLLLSAVKGVAAKLQGDKFASRFSIELSVEFWTPLRFLIFLHLANPFFCIEYIALCAPFRTQDF